MEHATFVFHAIFSFFLLVFKLGGLLVAESTIHKGFNKGICSHLSPGVEICLSHNSRINKGLAWNQYYQY